MQIYNILTIDKDLQTKAFFFLYKSTATKCTRHGCGQFIVKLYSFRRKIYFILQQLLLQVLL